MAAYLPNFAIQLTNVLFRSAEENTMTDLLIRFCIGGLVVSAFSLISDLFKPKTFAGLFGAAPSVALASLGLTVLTQGRATAATEARSMIIGAFALLLYALAVSYTLLRFSFNAISVSLTGLLLWLAAATGVWYAILVAAT
jgi:hypothetical protein